MPKITLDGLLTPVNIRLAQRSISPAVKLLLDVDMLTELRDSIIAHLSGSVPETAIDSPLRKFTRGARAENQHAEQVVIALKRVWESLHEERQRWPREAQLHLLDRLVTLCIDEYYAVPPASPAPPDQPGGSRGFVR